MNEDKTVWLSCRASSATGKKRRKYGVRQREEESGPRFEGRGEEETKIEDGGAGRRGV